MSFKKFILEKIKERKTTKGVYIYRKLMNADELKKWANSNEIETYDPNEFHTTIAYSKRPFKKELCDQIVHVEPENLKQIHKFGDSVVLLFNSDKLQGDWKKCIDNGATWDYESYNPHVTLNTSGNIPTFAGLPNFPLIFGPEIKEAL